jgi:hypothetical protein
MRVRIRTRTPRKLDAGGPWFCYGMDGNVKRDYMFEDVVSILCVFYNAIIMLDINLLCHMLDDVVLCAHVNSQRLSSQETGRMFCGGST